MAKRLARRNGTVSCRQTCGRQVDMLVNDYALGVARQPTQQHTHNGGDNTQTAGNATKYRVRYYHNHVLVSTGKQRRNTFVTTHNGCSSQQHVIDRHRLSLASLHYPYTQSTHTGPSDTFKPQTHSTINNRT